MLAGQRVPSVNATAFIMLHGVVMPVSVSHTPSSRRLGCYQQPCYEYTLSATDLPENIQLYAPSILGYSYYDENTTDKFIQGINEKYKHTSESKRPSYIDFCLQQINEFEKKHVRRLKNKLEDEYELGLPHGLDREKRLYKLEATTYKPRVVWKQHRSYITEKTYDIDQDNTLPNCIMIFCENVKSDVKDIINTTFNQPKTIYGSSNGQSIEYTVLYDSNSSTFRINFGNEDYLENIPFEDIRYIILFLLIQVSPSGTTLKDINLTIFDFTCSELEFPPDDVLTGLKPMFLSSDDSDMSDPKLVYGTIPTDRDTQMEMERRNLYAPLNALMTPRTNLSSVSPSHSQSSGHFDDSSATPSPARASTASLVVHLLPDVESFADFRLLIESQSNSQSVSPSRASMLAFEYPSSSVASSSASSSSSDYGQPAFRLSSSPSQSIERLGGSRRRRAVKKVSRKRYHNRRTKVHSKRSRRQSGTKSKR